VNFNLNKLDIIVNALLQNNIIDKFEFVGFKFVGYLPVDKGYQWIQEVVKSAISSKQNHSLPQPPFGSKL
jgi:hypothetical protein